MPPLPRWKLVREVLENLVEVSALLGSDYALRKNDPFGVLVRNNPESFLPAVRTEDLLAELNRRVEL